MSRCKKCGAESDGRHFCSACRRKWIEKRKIAFDQATSEFGPLSAVNHGAIKKRIKELEKEKP